MVNPLLYAWLNSGDSCSSADSQTTGEKHGINIPGSVLNSGY